MSLYERADQLIEHHKERLNELRKIIQKNPGITCYDAAAQMKWSIRTKDWDHFPVTQKFFAVGEAAAHLIYLERRGLIHSHVEQGVRLYNV